jgi:hypothetical protein
MRRTITMRSVITGAVACAVALVSVACGSTADDPRASAGSEEQFVHRTVVQLHPDGTQTVHDAWVPLKQSLAEAQARQSQATPASSGSASQQTTMGENVGTTTEAISMASCSDPKSIWLWDSNDYNPLNGRYTCPPATYQNEICFEGAGRAFLGQYRRCTSQICMAASCTCLQTAGWEDAVRSYYPGDSGGLFSSDLGGSESFNAGQKCTIAQGRAMEGYALTLYNN